MEYILEWDERLDLEAANRWEHGKGAPRDARPQDLAEAARYYRYYAQEWHQARVLAPQACLPPQWDNAIPRLPYRPCQRALHAFEEARVAHANADLIRDLRPDERDWHHTWAGNYELLLAWFRTVC